MLGIKVAAVMALSAALFMAFSHGSSPQQQSPQRQDVRKPMAMPEGAKDLYMAGGCFWCVEGMFEQLQGVIAVESGYAGGNRSGVSYEEVCAGNTGHAETVRVIYDPKQITADDLLTIFFTVHDPTTLNRQGPDVGTQYRSAIFYRDAAEKAEAEKIRNQIQQAKLWKNRIVTSIEPLRNYTRAEEYHQNYYDKYEHATDAERMHMNAGYCAAVVEPHVIEFRERYAKRLKKH